MYEKITRIAGISGAVTVILGAFGAHALKPHLSDYQVSIYEKGIQYQFVHTLAILAIGLLVQNGTPAPWLRRAILLFLIGMICFSGSLYLLACRDLIPFPVGWAGPVTPLGGLCFIAGWVAIALHRREGQP